METSVSPEGIFSVTVTAPSDAPALAPFETVTVYMASVCPSRKAWACVLVMLKAAGFEVITVKSVLVWPIALLPETVTELTTVEGALGSPPPSG